MAPKTPANLLEERLQAKRAGLAQQLTDIDSQISAAESAASKRIASTDNPRVLQGVAEPLLLLREQRNLIVRAISEVDKRIAEAPARLEAYLQSLKPLDAALSSRDVVAREVEGLFTALLAKLFDMRAKNEACFDALLPAAKAWRACGRPAEPMLRCPAVHFDDELRRRFVKDTPFCDITLRGDQSGRAQSIIRNNDAAPDEMWGD